MLHTIYDVNPGCSCLQLRQSLYAAQTVFSGRPWALTTVFSSASFLFLAECFLHKFMVYKIVWLVRKSTITTVAMAASVLVMCTRWTAENHNRDKNAKSPLCVRDRAESIYASYYVRKKLTMSIQGIHKYMQSKFILWLHIILRACAFSQLRERRTTCSFGNICTTLAVVHFVLATFCHRT